VSGRNPRLSRALTAHALLLSGLSFVHSLRARGLRRTLLFAGPGLGLPILGEYVAINTLKLLRHRTEPEFAGVPVAIALGWYNVGYGTFAMMESILSRTGSAAGNPGRALSPATALVATSLDLLMDPCGLDLGLWEWNGDGRYAAEVAGPNGKRGVPLLNFAGWLGLTASVTTAYQRLDPPHEAAVPPRRGVAGSPEAGRDAALVLLSYYLPAAAWALRRRRRKYLLYSAPFSAVLLWTALGGRPPDP
jgi:uncharacterized membrane protein